MTTTDVGTISLIAFVIGHWMQGKAFARAGYTGCGCLPMSIALVLVLLAGGRRDAEKSIESYEELVLSIILFAGVPAAYLFAVYWKYSRILADTHTGKVQCPSCGSWRCSDGRRMVRGSTVYSYSCILCGYSWFWDHTKPYPSVTVRPDVIEAGAKRIEEAMRQVEEEAREAKAKQDINESRSRSWDDLDPYR